ncbi:MAG: hypothetical protein AAF721_25340 [Myxococcota bacterium]
MRKLLIPLMKTEDPVLWGLLAVVAGYALLGAVLAWHRARSRSTSAARD